MPVSGHLLPLFFFFNDTATTEIYTLSLHDALPIYRGRRGAAVLRLHPVSRLAGHASVRGPPLDLARAGVRSEEHTSELQSQSNLVCRLLLEKKKKNEHMKESIHPTLVTVLATSGGV